MTPQPTIETGRLLLRPFTPEDSETVSRLAGDRAIADTTMSIPHPYEDGMAEDWIKKHAGEWDEGNGVTFAITRKDNGSLIGAIGLMGKVQSEVLELGYWIAASQWKQGYATEAARAVVDFGFTQLDLSRIHACHLTRNPASGRVLGKIGMRHEGCRRKHVRKWDVLEDLELYGILREDWRRG